jgi:UPF0716 protein FxsA
MIVQLLLLVVLLPLADLLLLLIIARFTGVWLALGLVVASALCGILLAKRQWRQIGQRAQQQLAQNQIPSDMASEAVLVVLTAGLLVTPGVITDLIGLSLLWPRCRRWYRERILNWLRSAFRISVLTQTPRGWPPMRGDEIYEGDFRAAPPASQPLPPRLEDES